MQTEITIMQAIKMAEQFCPVKIFFNGVCLYDDYDLDEEVIPEAVITKRFWRLEDYLVESLYIEIVNFHHSIIHMKGKMKKNET